MTLSKITKCCLLASAAVLLCATAPATAKERIAVEDMARYCAGEASAKFDVSPRDIITLPVEKAGHGHQVYGQFPAEGQDVSTFECHFKKHGALKYVKLTHDARHTSSGGSSGAEIAGIAGAAALIIGIAALAHDEQHHRDGQHHATSHEESEFERGYRDGVHGEDYDSRHSSEAYGQGFDAGVKERSNRLSHKSRDEREGPDAPPLAMRGCVGEASANWDINPRDIEVVKTEQPAADDFLVEVAAGHKHGVCEVSAQGNVLFFRDGRI
jgi:hypothetical protein